MANATHNEHQYRHMVNGPHPHKLPVGLYWAVFGILVFLTLLTVVLSRFDFGSASVFITLAIAGTKATLVLAVFMHLYFDNKFFALIISVSLVFLSLFILFPIVDLGSRGMVDAQRGNFGPRDEAAFKYKMEHPDALPMRPGEPLKGVPTVTDKTKLIFAEPHHGGGEHEKH